MHHCPDCNLECDCQYGDGCVENCTHFMEPECSESETVDGWLCKCGNFQSGTVDCEKCGAAAPKGEA